MFFGSARITPDGPLGRYYDEARALARLLTEWSNGLPGDRRFVVCSGGGGGIMEAANRGAQDAGGRTVGLNIGLPNEQRPNPYISPGLGFEFHYFFMRKLWFSHLARALVVFPGGFGTLDELWEKQYVIRPGAGRTLSAMASTGVRLRCASNRPLMRCRSPGPHDPAQTASSPVICASPAAAKAATSSCRT